MDNVHFGIKNIAKILISFIKHAVYLRKMQEKKLCIIRNNV